MEISGDNVAMDIILETDNKILGSLTAGSETHAKSLFSIITGHAVPTLHTVG